MTRYVDQPGHFSCQPESHLSTIKRDVRQAKNDFFQFRGFGLRHFQRWHTNLGQQGPAAGVRHHISLWE